MRVKARERPRRPQLSIAPKRSEDLNPDNHAFYPSRGKTEAPDGVPIASRQLTPLATPAQAKGETQ